MARKRRRPLLAAAAGVLGAAGFILAGFHYRLPISEALARELTRPMALEKSDVIFVMGGDPQSRLTFAVDLYERGYGRRVWAATTAVSKAYEAFGRKFGFRIDEQANVEKALPSALPEGSWKVLGGSFNTYTDLELLKRQLAEEPASSVLIVSSPMHFRRIEFCLRKIFGSDSGVRFRYAYPVSGVLDDDMIYSENMSEEVLRELVKNAAYRLKYGL
jgi:uncharacterized SAM-binding protein YcdF (DUF218 family)